MARTHAAASALIAIFLATRAGRSQTAPPRPEPRLTEPPAPVIPAPGVGELPIPGGEPGRPLVDLQNAPPPPTNVVYVQYGVAFTTEVVTAAGPMCDNRAVPCILGPGGGVAIRAGWRGTGPWYLGGAYELSKQDPNKLLRLAWLEF